MAKIKADIDTKKLMNWIRKTETGFPQDAKNLLGLYTVEIYQHAHDWCPVRTGYLRDSITMELQKGGTVGVVRTNGVYYAKFVEWGTINQHAQPFMRPAWNVYSTQFYKELFDLILKYKRML